MQNVSTIAAKNISEIESLAAHQEWFLESWEEENPWARKLIEKSLDERLNSMVPTEMVKNTALARYFRLLDATRVELHGMFSEDELAMMLHACPRPVLAGEYETTPANIFFSAFGEELLPCDTAEYRLCEKLAGLSAMQQVALIDVLECAWRDRSVGPLAYALMALGEAPTISGRA